MTLWFIQIHRFDDDIMILWIIEVICFSLRHFLLLVFNTAPKIKRFLRTISQPLILGKHNGYLTSSNFFKNFSVLNFYKLSENNLNEDDN